VRLISKVLGFVLSKAFLIAAMTVILFVGYFTIHALRGAAERQDRLEDVIQQREGLKEDLDDLEHARKASQAEAQRRAVKELADQARANTREIGRNVADQRNTIRHLEEVRDQACGFRGKVVDVLTPGSSCDTANRAVDRAKKTLRTFEGSLAEVKREADILTDPHLSNAERLERLGRKIDDAPNEQIETRQAKLRELDEDVRDLTEAQDSLAGQVVRQWGQSGESVLDQWAQSWKWLLGIVLVVVLAPPFWRTVGYWVVMPVVSRARKPIQLAAAAEYPEATLHTGPAERTLPIRLAAGEVLSARSEHVRPVRGKARSRILYDWSAPFISFAAGLYGLSRITGDAMGTEATLATPDDPSSYLMRIDFEDHPGVVMHPKHVVGVIGTPELVTKWQWGVQSLATWQVRYILFAGTGSLIVQGSGDVAETSPGERSTKMEQHLLMGFDSRLTARVNRTEVFWPYLWGKTPLVDDEFVGPYLFFWQKSNTDERSNPAVKAFNAVFSAIGKLLGF
jgi:hypothetical protein